MTPVGTQADREGLAERLEAEANGVLDQTSAGDLLREAAAFIRSGGGEQGAARDHPSGAPSSAPQGQRGDGIHLLSFDDKRLGKTKITATPYSAEDLENLAQLLDTNIRTGHDIPSCFNGNTLSRLIAQCYRAFASPTPPPAPSTPDLAAVKALGQFVAHYPMGVNPFLDDAYRAAREILSTLNGGVK